MTTDTRSTPGPAPAASRPSPLLGPLRITSVLVGVALVGLGVLTVITTFATREKSESLTVRESVTTMRVNIGAGDVTVHDGPAGSPTTVGVTTRSAFRDATWSHTMQNGTLGLTGSCPGRWPIDTCSIDLDIVVPADVTLDLHTGSGDQSLSGLTGPATLRAGSGDVQVDGLSGDLDAHTGSGDISATLLSSGRAELRTGSGDVAAEFTAATTSASIRTGAGDVEADFLAAPAQVMAKTGSGDLKVLVPDDGTAYDVSGTTGSGDRQITVPTGSATHQIEANTGSGDVTIERR